LLAAFLGFGLGFLLQEKSDRLLTWFPKLICYLTIIIAGAKGFGITHVIFTNPEEFFLLGSWPSAPSLLQRIKALLVIVSLFFLVMATFAAIASKVGNLLNREKGLTGYSINVFGSLIGILAFSCMSYLEWPPTIWLTGALLPLLPFYQGTFRRAGIYFLASIAFAVVSNALNPAMWSPYYRLSVVKDNSLGKPQETYIGVNYDGFQMMLNLSPEYLRQFPEAAQRAYSRHYNIPYLLRRGPVDSVLILGGGSGNDAAAALRHGVRRVDVVEIDPVVARIGKELHPERPYASPRVNLYIDDARSFLQKTKDTYDLVMFATLDSHTVFSSLSSVRLDNFIFTKESIDSAKSKLNPGGGIAINFFTNKDWLYQRHFDSLKQATGKSPLVFNNPSNQDVLLLAGDGFDPSVSLGITNYVRASFPQSLRDVELTRDDWPFLFLEKRGIPFHYLLPLGIIFGLSFIPLKKAHLTLDRIDWHLFLMGAAFFLIETKAITTLALVFGSTWIVNSIVIGSVMVMILAANALVSRTSRLNFWYLYFCLFASLLINFSFSFDVLNRLDWFYRLLSSGGIVALPLFFAALIFAKAFATVKSPSLSLASNLLGGIAGGILEYLDMWIGLNWLNMVALFLYAISFAFLAHRWKVSKLTMTSQVLSTSSRP
jgi:spermidine synthase